MDEQSCITINPVKMENTTPVQMANKRGTKEGIIAANSVNTTPKDCQSYAGDLGKFLKYIPR